MHSRASIYSIFAMLLLLGNFAFADVIVDFDFEGSNDPSNPFSFSQSGFVDIAVSDDSPNGNGGTEGAEFSVASQSNNASFAGGGFGFSTYQ